MDACSKPHPAGRVKHKRQRARQTPRTQTSEATEPMAWAGRGPQTNPFGPQSQWSSLLCERELLQDEILRGQKYLTQLHRDVAAGCALLQAWADCEAELAETPEVEAATPISVGSTLEDSLRSWIGRLEERLQTVMRDIDVLPSQKLLESQDPEEFVFTLLRAAG
jgi:hypothetical protein